MGRNSHHACPICSAPVPHQDRYPQAVCQDCSHRACDAQGRRLAFFNLSISGGFAAVIAETQEVYPSHVCYIDGVACWADEDYFGGIVIQIQSESRA